MGVHLKHLIELAHLEQHCGIKVASLELPPIHTELVSTYTYSLVARIQYIHLVGGSV